MFKTELVKQKKKKFVIRVFNLDINNGKTINSLELKKTSLLYIMKFQLPCLNWNFLPFFFWYVTFGTETNPEAPQRLLHSRRPSEYLYRQKCSDQL